MVGEKGKGELLLFSPTLLPNGLKQKAYYIECYATIHKGLQHYDKLWLFQKSCLFRTNVIIHKQL